MLLLDVPAMQAGPFKFLICSIFVYTALVASRVIWNWLIRSELCGLARMAATASRYVEDANNHWFICHGSPGLLCL